MKNLIIASTSTLHDQDYLEYILNPLSDLYKNKAEIVFVPYARPGGISHDDYTTIAAKAFRKINKSIVGLHTFANPIEAINNANGIFIGGGNTFVLVNKIYQNKLITPLLEAIKQGVPYLGTSAGSNICGLTMQTTNDMPIVYPPSFKTLGVVPFNINPHYLDPDPKSTHMGETREKRIGEFHHYNTAPVVGLREGSWLRVHGEDIILNGKPSMRIFEFEKEPYELGPNSNLKNLN